MIPSGPFPLNETKASSLARLYFSEISVDYVITCAASVGISTALVACAASKAAHVGAGTCRAALLSLLVPGLGQIYNGEPWKIPIYWGFLMGSYHYLQDNTVKYKHFKQIYIDASDPDSGYDGRISADTAKYYKDMYREWRDYSILAIAASYLLQVIDANVFAYMRDFEVSEDLSVNLQPTVITPDTQFAYNPYGFGLKLGISF